MPYFKTEVIAGRTIEVHKSYSKRIGDRRPRGKREKPTPEEMEKVNQKNAETRLRRLINANFGCGDFHLILTYKRELRPNPQEAKQRIEKFIRALRKEYKKVGADLKYIHVTEYLSAAIHHHLIINDIENKNVSKIIRDLWEWGNPKFTPLDNTGQYSKLAEYLVKETSKTYKESDSGHKQRWSSSKNLIKPVTKTTIIKKAEKWAAEPKPKKGFYIDKDSIENGVNFWNGQPFQRYIMVSTDYGGGGRCG